MFIENVWNDAILLISKRQRKDRNKNYFVLELHGLKRKNLYDDVGVERCLTDCSVLRTLTSPLPLRSVLNVCHWHTAPCPIFAYREAYAPLLCLRSASVGAKRTSTGCSAPYRGGSLSHKTTPVQAHRGFRLLALASLYYVDEISRKFYNKRKRGRKVSGSGGKAIWV